LQANPGKCRNAAIAKLKAKQVTKDNVDEVCNELSSLTQADTNTLGVEDVTNALVVIDSITGISDPPNASVVLKTIANVFNTIMDLPTNIAAAGQVSHLVFLLHPVSAILPFFLLAD